MNAEAEECGVEVAVREAMSSRVIKTSHELAIIHLFLIPDYNSNLSLLLQEMLRNQLEMFIEKLTEKEVDYLLLPSAGFSI